MTGKHLGKTNGSHWRSRISDKLILLAASGRKVLSWKQKRCCVAYFQRWSVFLFFTDFQLKFYRVCIFYICRNCKQN